MFENKIFILLCWYIVTWDQGAELSNIFKYVSWFRIDVIYVMNGRYMLAIAYHVLFLHYEPQQFHNTKCLCYMYNHYNPCDVAIFAFNKYLSAKDNSKKSGDWSIFFSNFVYCTLYPTFDWCTHTLARWLRVQLFVGVYVGLFYFWRDQDYVHVMYREYIFKLFVFRRTWLQNVICSA